MRIALEGAVLLVLVVAGCGGGTRVGTVQRVPSPTARVAGGSPAHIAVVVMENREYSDVIGSGSAPYINHLARAYALATQSYAVGHPSLPNYLALTGGSTFGISSDCTSCAAVGSGLAGELERAQISWKAYMEGLPRPCFEGVGSGEYARKHDPFMYYPGVAANPMSCSHIVPLSELASDERRHTLPRFIWITPNMCHDVHDCSLSAGDRFLSGLLPRLLRSLGRDGLLFLTWDEGTSDDGCCRLAAGGHIATIVAGPGARPGARLNTPIDHYSVLQAIDDLLGLARLGHAGCACTPTLAPLLRQSVSVSTTVLRTGTVARTG